MTPISLKEQIGLALDLYERRGEFDGSLASARNCLETADYEWRADIEAAVRELRPGIK